MAKSEQIRIEIDADASKAHSELDGIATEAETLERVDPEIAVTADTDQATRALEGLADDAQALSRQDAEIVLRAKIDDAKAALKTLRTDMEQTGDKAEDTARRMDKMGGDGGLKTRGNAIADLTGPFGEASGAASDFGGIFDGLSDISEDVAGKIGVDAAKMATAIGGIGIAVAAGAAAWTFFQEQQRKARERQRELVQGQREIDDAIRQGDLDAAARKFQELYKGPLKYGRELGATTSEITGFITGQSTALESNIAKWKDQGGNIGVAAGLLEDARDQYTDTNGTLAEQDDELRNITSAFGGMTTATDKATRAAERHERQVRANRDAMDRLRGALSMEQAFEGFKRAMSDAMTATEGEAQTTQDEIFAIKDAIFDVAEFAKLTPVQVATLLQKVDNGDLAGAAADIEGYYNANKVDIATQLRDPSSFDIAEYRRRMTAAIGEVPVTLRVAQIRSGAQTAV